MFQGVLLGNGDDISGHKICSDGEIFQIIQITQGGSDVSDRNDSRQVPAVIQHDKMRIGGGRHFVHHIQKRLRLIQNLKGFFHEIPGNEASQDRDVMPPDNVDSLFNQFHFIYRIPEKHPYNGRTGDTGHHQG